MDFTVQTLGPTLAELAIKHGTDKHGHHDYCRHYQQMFQPFRNEPISLLEIGIGGEEKLDVGGHSLRMWAEFFPHAKIYGVDIYDKSFCDTGRIKTFVADQSDSEAMIPIMRGTDPDIFIDDGNHRSPYTIATFGICWPLLKPGGIYVIEDIHASYWVDHGFDGGLENPKAIMNQMKYLIDSLNHHESGITDVDIDSMHFYKELLILTKKR